MREWSRSPLSPIAESWQLPILENAIFELIRSELGFSIPKNSTKIFNGYIYITNNFVRFLFWPSSIKFVWNLFWKIKVAKNAWEKQTALYLDYLKKVKTSELAEFSDKQLYEFCNEVLQKDEQNMAWSLYVGIYSHGFEYLFAWVLPVFVKNSEKFDYREFLRGFPNKSLEADRGLWKLSKLIRNDENLKGLFIRKTNKEILQGLAEEKYKNFQNEFSAWLNDYGHKIHDFDLILPTLQEQPEIVISLLKQFLAQNAQDPLENLKRAEIKRNEQKNKVLQNIKWWLPFGEKLFLKLLSTTQSYVSIREDRPFYYQGQALARKALLELGKRFKDTDILTQNTDIFFITKVELHNFLQKRILFDKKVVEKRKSLYEKQKKQTAPIDIKEPFGGDFPNKEVIKEEKILRGISASAGEVIGKAKIILSQNDFDKFQTGEILVTEATSPAWTPLITLASGVITDIGGMLCHAAIVSREIGIPAVVSTQNASIIIKDGDLVKVDGTNGVVEILDKNFVGNSVSQKNIANQNAEKDNSDEISNISHLKTDLILPISAVTKDDLYLVGGKGANLGELLSIGLNVPEGFILTTEMYGKNLLDFEKEIMAQFDNLKTKFVAVRSSATAEDSPKDSFAGQFETYLNTTRENLFETIKKCWDSINSARISKYLESKGINKNKIKIAVVIQKMIQPEISGICFTANPITKDKNQIIVEAIYGLGELIVSGEVTPDSYVISKSPFEIIKKEISKQITKIELRDGKSVKQVIESEMQSQQKLSDDKILNLARLVIKAEQHYGKELDIEWAFKKDICYLVQARPITTF